MSNECMSLPHAMPCYWLQDEVCTNDKCPVCCDFCPVVNYPGVCRYEERGVNNDGNAN